MTGRAVLLASLLLPAAACGARDGGEEPIGRTHAPEPATTGDTAVEEEPEEAAEQSGLAVRNASQVDVCSVHVSPKESNDWGDNRLEGDDRLDAGETQGWRLAPGLYDLRLSDCEGNLLLDQRDVRVEGQGILVTYQ